MLKKLISGILIAVLAVTALAGCTKTADKGDDSVFKYTLTVGSNDLTKGDYHKYIVDKFGIDFEFVPLTGDAGDKMRIWILSGDMPDIMDGGSLQMHGYRSFARQGSFKEIPDLSACPNISNLMKNTDGYENFYVDGKLYALPRDNDEQSLNYLNPCQFIYRKDWAKKVGLYNENDEYTWEEFLEMGKRFKEQDPGGNGKTIPIALENWAFPMAVGLTQKSIYWEMYYEKDGKYVWGPGQKEAVEGLKEVKDIYDSGILWDDQILARYGDGAAKFDAGESGIVFNSYSVPMLHVLQNNFEKANPNVKIEDAVAPMYVKCPDNDMLWIPQDLTYAGFTVFSPSISDEKMNRLLEFWDWTLTEEGYDYSTLGIKDKDWKDINGEKEILWSKDENGDFEWPYGDQELRVIDLPKWTNSFILENPRFTKWSRDTFRGMIDRHMKDDVIIKKQNYDIIAFSAQTFDKYGTYQKEVEDKMKEIIVSSKDSAELETQYKAYIESMQSKITPILDEINAGIKSK